MGWLWNTVCKEHGETSLRNLCQECVLEAINMGSNWADGGENRPNLSFNALREVNVTRCKRWHPPESVPWTSADWSNALCGEAGELANVVKKIRRHETGARNEGDPDVETLKKMAALELADVVIYADLVAHHFGIDLAAAVKAKFNLVSVKYGFPERLL